MDIWYCIIGLKHRIDYMGYMMGIVLFDLHYGILIWDLMVFILWYRSAK